MLTSLSDYVFCHDAVANMGYEINGEIIPKLDTEGKTPVRIKAEDICFLCEMIMERRNAITGSAGIMPVTLRNYLSSSMLSGLRSPIEGLFSNIILDDASFSTTTSSASRPTLASVYPDVFKTFSGHPPVWSDHRKIGDTDYLREAYYEISRVKRFARTGLTGFSGSDGYSGNYGAFTGSGSYQYRADVHTDYDGQGRPVYNSYSASQPISVLNFYSDWGTYSVIGEGSGWKLWGEPTGNFVMKYDGKTPSHSHNHYFNLYKWISSTGYREGFYDGTIGVGFVTEQPHWKDATAILMFSIISGDNTSGTTLLKKIIPFPAVKTTDSSGRYQTLFMLSGYQPSYSYFRGLVTEAYPSAQFVNHPTTYGEMEEFTINCSILGLVASLDGLNAEVESLGWDWTPSS